MLYPKTPYRLVIILVAEGHTTNGNTSQGVQNITDLDIRSNPTHVDDGIEGQRVAVVVDAVDRVSTYGRVIVLPDTEAVIDEAVVHIEDRITGAGRDIGHDATDTVVSISVGSRPIGKQLVHHFFFFLFSLWRHLPAFTAALHIGVRRSGVASVDETRVALRGQGSIASTRQAVRRIAGAWANVGSEPSKGTAGNTDGVAIDGPGQVAEVVRAGEHIGRGEVAGVQSLIPPNHGAIEATLGSQDLLEGPEVIAMPHEEFGVAVDIRHVLLVQAGEILIPVRRGGEVARWRLVHQALDGGDESQPVGGRVLPPFVADIRVGCARRCL
jgi:hypothetical protein